MPYCWDGHDNAARAETTGTGRRMTRDGWNPAQLADAMRTLLEDAEMRARLKRISREMVATPGASKAARMILDRLGALQC